MPKIYDPTAKQLFESDTSDTFQDRPVVIVEVISESTRRTDEGEKRDNYLSIPSLCAYVLLEQDRAAARLFQRGSDGEFFESLHCKPDSVIPLAAIEAELRFTDLYAGMTFPVTEA